MSATIKSCVLLLFLAAAAQGRYARRPDINRGVAEVKLVATWEEAKERCQRDGAILASPLNVDLLAYLHSHISVNNHSTPYFIGMKARSDPELRFVSIEGTDLDDLPEALFDMIDRIDPLEGDCLCMDQHSIRAVSCWKRLPYVCYTAETNQETTPAQETQATEVFETGNRLEPAGEESTGDCGSGYTRYSTGSCYKPHEEMMTWDAAKSVCAAEGGHLIVLNDQAEVQLALQLRPSNSVWMWVGLRRDTMDRNWRTVQGDRFEDVFHVWARDRYNKYDCGFLRPHGALDDLNCDDHLEPFICEKRR